MARQRWDIETRTARRALVWRIEPYWRRIAAGQYLGYRPSRQGGEGSWIARLRDENGRQNYKVLGAFEDIDPAIKAARAWFETFKQSGRVEPLTVALACKHYVKELHQQGRDQAAKDAESRFNRTVYGTGFGVIKLDRLRADHVKQWRDGFKNLKAKSTNRELSVLRAALNLAFREGLCATDVAWRGVKPLTVPEGQSTRRDRWLNAAERQALLSAAHPALQPFVKALLLTAARPGELAACDVAHFDRKKGVLRLPSGKTGSRDIPLSSAMIELATEQCRDKLPGAPLFTDPDGRRWHKNTWALWVREARRMAGLGEDVSLYTLRHTAISEMIAGGMDPFSVARMAGTSTSQIDKHYGHLCNERARNALDKVRLV